MQAAPDVQSDDSLLGISLNGEQTILYRVRLIFRPGKPASVSLETLGRVSTAYGSFLNETDRFNEKSAENMAK